MTAEVHGSHMRPLLHGKVGVTLVKTSTLGETGPLRAQSLLDHEVLTEHGRLASSVSNN
jgi:hypothetical protein